jgi:sterol desaturase/sphingolipid hydroxylase (fatty acid hydroxylase superfamily)
LPGAIATATHDLPLWLRAALSMKIGEVGFYWGHRWSHEIPLLRRFHAIHHNAELVDWLVASRQHPFDTVFTRTCGFVPLTIFGLLDPLSDDPGSVALAVLLAGQVWAFFIYPRECTLALRPA